MEFLHIPLKKMYLNFLNYNVKSAEMKVKFLKFSIIAIKQVERHYYKSFELYDMLGHPSMLCLLAHRIVMISTLVHQPVSMFIINTIKRKLCQIAIR